METPGILVDPEQLAAALRSTRPPAVLDVRWRLGGPPGIEEFHAGHVPGARFVDLDRDLAAPPGRGGRHPLPEAEAFAAAMRRSGVRGDRTVIVYDAADSTSAARAWWLLRFFGHGDVRVLDGGWRAWAAADLPVETGDPPAANGDFTPHPGCLPIVAAAAAAAIAADGVLLDARAAERFRGEVEPVDRVAGHIPGARSAPTAGNVDGEGRFLSAESLRERFAALGIPTASSAATVAAYCGSGVTAAHEVLALALAGIPASLYVGSWSEWITDPSRPIATGPD